MDKILKTVFRVLPVLLIASCSSTKFTEYQDSNIIQGQGGAVRTVKGIEIWTDGSPNRKFKVIGVIDHTQRHGRGLVGMMMQSTQRSLDSQLAAETKAHDGDAVVIVQQDRRLDDIGGSGGGTDWDNGARHGHSTKVFVIKYVDAGN
jgi:hypothetical protein